GDFAIVGWTAGRGARAGFGALHLAARAPEGDLVYVGRVGSGLHDRAIRALGQALAPLATDAPKCRSAPRSTRLDHWVEPRLVAEVAYSEGTRDGRLRQPVFVRVRDDKPLAEIDAPPPPGRGRREEAARGPEPEPPALAA